MSVSSLIGRHINVTHLRFDPDLIDLPKTRKKSIIISNATIIKFISSSCRMKSCAPVFNVVAVVNIEAVPEPCQISQDQVVLEEERQEKTVTSEAENPEKPQEATPVALVVKIDVQSDDDDDVTPLEPTRSLPADVTRVESAEDDVKGYVKSASGAPHDLTLDDVDGDDVTALDAVVTSDLSYSRGSIQAAGGDRSSRNSSVQSLDQTDATPKKKKPSLLKRPHRQDSPIPCLR